MYIYRLSHYAQPTIHIARYTLRTDGFVSVNAPYAGGELLTRLLKFSGAKFEVNFATSAAGDYESKSRMKAENPFPVMRWGISRKSSAMKLIA